MNDYNPDLQQRICIDRKLCFFGNFPTLADLNQLFGSNMASAWLIPQLLNLSEFCGCKDKLQGYSLKECAIIIAQNFYYLKISELMLFFYRFKLGRYGKFYGVVDPLTITSSLQEFLRERNIALFEKESELNFQQLEEDKKNAITYEEYLERKKEKQMLSK